MIGPRRVRPRRGVVGRRRLDRLAAGLGAAGLSRAARDRAGPAAPAGRTGWAGQQHPRAAPDRCRLALPRHRRRRGRDGRPTGSVKVNVDPVPSTERTVRARRPSPRSAAGDEQPEPGAAGRHPQRVLDPVELLEDPVELVLRDAAAGVGDRRRRRVPSTTRSCTPTGASAPEYLRPLETRLDSTCTTRTGSHSTGTGSSGVVDGQPRLLGGEVLGGALDELRPGRRGPSAPPMPGRTPGRRAAGPRPGGRGGRPGRRPCRASRGGARAGTSRRGGAAGPRSP